MPPPLEVAVFSPASALLAQAAGVGRVELNAPGSYGAGGTTPPIDTFGSLSAQMSIPVRVMIRPRGPPSDGGPDFFYTDQEFETMGKDVQSFTNSGHLDVARGDGFVFGILQKGEAGKLQVDVERCSQLVQLAYPFPCVFHRAFDPIAATSEWSNGLRDLERSKFQGLLTAGGSGNMLDNLPQLGAIVATCRQKNIQVVAGGGLRANVFNNGVTELMGRDGCNVWMHTAALGKGPDGQTCEDVDTAELKALLAKMVL